MLWTRQHGPSSPSTKRRTRRAGGLCSERSWNLWPTAGTLRWQRCDGNADENTFLELPTKTATSAQGVQDGHLLSEGRMDDGVRKEHGERAEKRRHNEVLGGSQEDQVFFLLFSSGRPALSSSSLPPPRLRVCSSSRLLALLSSSLCFRVTTSPINVQHSLAHFNLKPLTRQPRLPPRGNSARSSTPLPDEAEQDLSPRRVILSRPDPYSPAVSVRVRFCCCYLSPPPPHRRRGCHPRRSPPPPHSLPVLLERSRLSAACLSRRASRSSPCPLLPIVQTRPASGT